MSTDTNNGSHIEILAKLAAACLFLSTLEYMIPKALPFMKIGLANVPVMISFALLDPAGIALLVLMKVLGQSLVNGTLFSYIIVFSAGGSFISAAVMYLFFRLGRDRFSFIGISVAGALASNLVQLLLARFILFGPAVLLIAPPFLIAGLISSLLLGYFTEMFIDRSAWYGALLEHRPDRSSSVLERQRMSFDARFITGLLLLPALLFQEWLTGTLFIASIAVLLALGAGRKFRILPNMILLLSVTAANLLQKNGLILFDIAGAQITLGALQIGLKKSLTLLGMMYLSQYMASSRPMLPGRIGALLSLQISYFQQMTDVWRRGGERKDLFGGIDALFFGLDSPGTEQLEERPAGARSLVIQISVVVLSWALLFYGMMLN